MTGWLDSRLEPWDVLVIALSLVLVACVAYAVSCVLAYLAERRQRIEAERWRQQVRKRLREMHANRPPRGGTA